jgi:hypothetical protein
VPTEPVVIKAARVVDAAKSDAPAPAK